MGHSCATPTPTEPSAAPRPEPPPPAAVEPAAPAATPDPAPTAAEPTRFVSVAAGESHACALRDDGRVYCWGNNHFGQVGADASFPIYVSPTRVQPLEDVRQIVAGPTHTCALASDGTVTCWGEHMGAFGGSGPAAPGRSTAVPRTIGLQAPAAELSTCRSRICARHASGTVSCWGQHPVADFLSARRGDVEVTLPEHPDLSPQAIAGVDDAVGLACRDEITCALRPDDQLRCWGAITKDGFDVPHEFRRPSSLIVYDAPLRPKATWWDAFACVGGECWAGGGGRVTPPRARAQTKLGKELPMADLRGLAAWPHHACVLPDQGPFRCFGHKGWGLEVDNREWNGVQGVEARAIAIGPAHGCAVDDDGAVVCWGLDNSGRLGTGSWGNVAPAPVRHDLHGTLAGLAASTLRDERVYAVLGNGKLFVWSPDGARVGVEAPFRVAGVAANIDDICAWTESGEVHCIRAETALRPDAVRGWSRRSGLSDVVSVDAGVAHFCALDRASEVWCWGDNDGWAIGDGTINDRPEPVRVLDGATAVVSGFKHNCALRRDGRVLCWGQGWEGQLGSQRVTELRVPTELPIHDAVDLATSDAHACVVHGDGGVSCWGDQFDRMRSTDGPARIPGVSKAIDVEVGSSHACARSRSGTLQCWGSASFGELGDPRLDRADLPVTVADLPPVQFVALGGNLSCAAPQGGPVYCWGYGADSRGKLVRFDPQPRPVADVVDP